MKRPFDPIPEKEAKEETSEGIKASKREFPKRKVAMVMGYSGTGYQGMQRYFGDSFVVFYLLLL